MKYLIQTTLGSHYETINKYASDFSFIVSAIMTVITYLFGGVDKALTALLVFCVIDILTGVFLAFKRKSFTSKRLKNGLTAKFVYFIIIIVANVLDGIFFQEEAILRTFSIWFYILVEASSIIENSSNISPRLPIPQILIDRMAQIESKVGGTAKKNDDGKFESSDEKENT